jgi:protocatechuate 3,4-dioxygenase beta subunit
MIDRSVTLPAWRTGSVDEGRRQAIKRLSACFAAGALTSSNVLAQTAGSCVLAPEVGEGPFYFDPDLLRSDITDGQPGAPLEVSMQVVREGDCATLAGARVDLWQADAHGLYSGYQRQRGTGAGHFSTGGGERLLCGV